MWDIKVVLKKFSGKIRGERNVLQQEDDKGKPKQKQNQNKTKEKQQQQTKNKTTTKQIRKEKYTHSIRYVKWIN